MTLTLILTIVGTSLVVPAFIAACVLYGHLRSWPTERRFKRHLRLSYPEQFATLPLPMVRENLRMPRRVVDNDSKNHNEDNSNGK